MAPTPRTTPRTRVPRTRVLRVLVLLLAAYGFWVFLQPVVVAGILNVGNAAGMAVVATPAVVVLAWARLSRTLTALRTTRRGRMATATAAGVAAVVIGVGAVWCGVLSARMTAAMSTRPDAPATLIVLGCRVEGETPSEALRNRIDTAADYLLAHPSVPVIVSGGQGPDERISEAEAMRRGLVERGVAEDRIVLEDRSTSTLENLTFAKELLPDGGRDASVVVVSEGYHLYRALSVADRVGLDAEGLAAPSPDWLRATSWVREWFAITLDTVRG